MATRCCGVCILLGLMLCHAPASWGADGIAEQIKPSGWFLQAGVGDAKTDAYVIGAKWDWRWVHPLSWGVVTGYFDADAGRWSTRHAGISSFAWATQVGGAPIFRLEQTPGLDRWFGEIGIGVNYIVPLYQSEYKRFSTEFNFGDQFAFGHYFGKNRRYELSVRVEHFSNAGISHPNPGENFVQLRCGLRT